MIENDGHRLALASLSLILALFTLAEGATAMEPNRLDSLDWLLGNWKSVGEHIIVHESWVRVSDTTFEGIGESEPLPSGKRKLSETLRLVEMSGDVFYLAYVSHNPRPVSFTLTGYSGGGATFENPDHDFPKKIVYRLESPDELTVTVSNEERGFTLEFERAK